MAEMRKATDRPTCHSRREHNTMGLNYHDEPRTDQTAQKAESCGKHYPDPCPAICPYAGDRFSKRQIDDQTAQGEAGKCWCGQSFATKIHTLTPADVAQAHYSITGHDVRRVEGKPRD